jgi:hypothetical protein
MTLFKELNPDCEIEFAKKEAEKRLIWKNNKFHAQRYCIGFKRKVNGLCCKSAV